MNNFMNIWLTSEQTLLGSGSRTQQERGLLVVHSKNQISLPLLLRQE